MSTFDITPSIRIPWSELQFSYSRSSGPGGQHVNKTNTKATLKWDVQQTAALPPTVKERFEKHWGTRISKEGMLVIQSEDSREQRSNMEACLDKLKHMVTLSAKRPKSRVPTKPSRGSVKRTQEKKRQRSDRKSQRRQSKNISYRND
ncbi:alternative ribosome rescue aminoacyl-tRNA hydrolase ArfB [Bremerella alba]|uniref:Peptidyl-tRNA hydrolase ArfB n=1 Tax=Bremerella alba TaxID=980252 RepID=A0A7V9A7K5_9BACT|nr:alternative ribosome rescue aminoacyl-tRNA hydrolase ArfB [Bremerella alba]MBA2115116.1 Peptidyl-tRNA hydrolase ArfB [Bremerella alba]